jgi:hypothetical protein
MKDKAITIAKVFREVSKAATSEAIIVFKKAKTVAEIIY